MDINSHPRVELTQIYPGAPRPVKADRSLAGSVPLRAWQHCEPLLAASGWGFLIYPPFLMAMLYDGTDGYWARLDDPEAEGSKPEWYMQGLPYPGFADVWRHFDAMRETMAPRRIEGERGGYRRRTRRRAREEAEQGTADLVTRTAPDPDGD